MKFLILIVLTVLCFLALAPLVIDVGKRVAKRLQKQQDKIDQFNSEEQNED